MNNLHAAFALRNLKAFRQELDGTGPNAAHQRGAHGHGVGSGSAGRSWQLKEFAQSTPVKADPNERDVQGRTVLHLACSATDQRAYEFLQCLLRHQQIAVNLQDYENGYTALHRALYAGNVRAARDLLARPDTDVGIKDAEGMTAFDVFNSTVEGTNPAYDAAGTDLYVWGVNRNFTLGVGDPNDRSYPDHVTLANPNAEHTPFATPRIHDISLSKLHSAVLTSDTRSNLQLCGFGSHGRLGRTIHSQYSFQPVPDMPQRISAVSLGQDHTLALTTGGYILSWGQNRFSQLGYESDAEIQVSPRRIVGPLKKENVVGVAAGRMASACWTSDAVWTWGTNAGQLGYEKAANPVQILPRKVTAISQPVLAIAISDYAMCCLLDTHEVVCLHHDAHFKISFSTPKVLSDAFPFRPPQSTLKPMIVKITAATTTFAALSSIGDVFTFNLPNPLEELAKDVRDRHVTVKPQLIWALRKHFTAVKDVALGSDGTVIICTHSGHVFVRQRSGKAGLKFKRIPYLQRIVKVTTNDTGAFAAVRVDARPKSIHLTGSVLEEDIGSLQPHMRRFQHQITAADFERINKTGSRYVDDDDDESTNSVAKDTRVALELCTVMSRWDAASLDSLFTWTEPLLGSDLMIIAGGTQTPAHRSIIAQRIPALRKLGSLGNGRIRLVERDGAFRLEIDGVHHLAILLLLQYIYTDDIAAIWDARVARRIQEVFSSLRISIVDVKNDVRDLVQMLGIAPLEPILASAGKNASLQRTISADLAAHFAAAQSSPGSDSRIVIQLADRDVHCNALLLRARCPFFESMLDDADWTKARGDDGGIIRIDMRHLKWRPMRLVFRFLYEGVEEDLFDYSHQETLDEFLDFVFEVMAAATELLLDRLVLVCSRVILRHVNTHNACSLAVEAGFYQATKLRQAILDYIIVCMETMLESGLLDEMDSDTLGELSAAIKARQEAKLPTPKKDVLLNQALDAHKDWLALQDYPAPRIRATPRQWRVLRSPKLSPVEFTSSRFASRGSPSPLASPELAPITPSTGIDEMFSMDDDAVLKGLDDVHISSQVTPRASGASTPLGRAGPVWKSRVVEAEKKTDMRSIMAEAAGAPAKPSPTILGPVTPASKLSQKDRRKLMNPPTPPLSAQASTFTPGTSAGSSASPWRKPSLPATPVSATDPAFSSSLAESRPKPGVNATRAQGPVFTPSRAAPQPIASSPGPRRVSSDSAWVNSTVFAPAPASASPGASTSLLDIQRQERDHSHSSKTKKAKSLIEIQEEERIAEVEKTAEEEFMRWWKEEEARVAAAEGNGPSSSSGGAKRGRGGGRGRGAPRRVPGRGGSAAVAAPANSDGQAPKDIPAKRGRNRNSKASASQSTPVL